MYKRKLEKCNNKASIIIEEQLEQKKQHTSRHYKDYNLQSMNLDITQRYSRRRKESEYF